jgi:hypothetical protein
LSSSKIHDAEQSFHILRIGAHRAEVKIPPPPKIPANLDAWLPRYDVRTRHERIVACPPAEALAIALRLPVGSDLIVRTLFRLRGYGAPSAPMGEFFSHGDFIELERTPTRFTFGLAGRLRGEPRRARTSDDWRAWPAPGLKIAADICAEPYAGGHTRLSTETRVLALDRRSRILFRLYWLAVRPFSTLIRRRWLRAISARAARA